MILAIGITTAGWLLGWLLMRRVPMLIQSEREQRAGVGQKAIGVSTEERCLIHRKENVESPLLLSVIVPARNEERNISGLLKSLNAQQLRSNMEIIVVDDGSSDRTAELSMELGALVIQPSAPEEGWRGKNWACWQGALQASGEALLFLDADIRLEEDGASGILTAFQSGERGFLSVQPYHRINHRYESLSAIFNLVVLASVGGGSGQKILPVAESLRGYDRSRKQKLIHGVNRIFNRSLNGAFGPCVICARADYFDIGGHKLVRDKLLEHFELGKVFAERGMRVASFAGRGAVSFRMYPGGLKELVQGWAKSFASGAASTPAPVSVAIALWLAGAVTAFITLMGGNGLPLWLGAAGYLAYAVQLRRWLRQAGGFHWFAVWLYPLPLATFMLVFAYSLYRTFIVRSVVWRGREVPMRKGGSRL